MHAGNGLHFAQGAEGLEAVEVLAGGDGGVGGAGEAGHGVVVLGRQWIFEPHGIGMLERVEALDGVVELILPVALDGEVFVGAEFVADGVHLLDDIADVVVGQAKGVEIVAGLRAGRVVVDGDAVALELPGGEAVFVVGLHLGGLIAPRRSFGWTGRSLQGAVEADSIAEASAEKVADGRLEDAAGEIPERAFDATGGGNGDSADGSGAARS